MTDGPSRPLPETDPNGPLDLGPALTALDDAHQAATAKNEAEWGHDPNQQATNQHFIDVRFGKAKRDVVKAKVELNKAVNSWLAQPGQTERPPLPVWTQMTAGEQKATDTVLAQNAQPTTELGPLIAQVEEETGGRRGGRPQPIGSEGREIISEIRTANYWRTVERILEIEPHNGRYSETVRAPEQEITDEDVARAREELARAQERAAGPFVPESELGIRPGFGARTEPPIFRYNRAVEALREVDPQTQRTPYPPGSEARPTEADADAAERELAEAVNRRIVEYLKPGRRYIGTEGSRTAVRTMPGGQAAADAMFEELSKFGRPVQRPTYPGKSVSLPGGGIVSLRTNKDGLPTIDVNVPGLARGYHIHFTQGEN
ncbi:MAG TPA: hypothetical protein VMI56_22750 [Reyranella sp.]|nr:hypothetical protein [Reyranella sp.]